MMATVSEMTMYQAHSIKLSADKTALEVIVTAAATKLEVSSTPSFHSIFLVIRLASFTALLAQFHSLHLSCRSPFTAFLALFTPFHSLHLSCHSPCIFYSLPCIISFTPSLLSFTFHLLQPSLHYFMHSIFLSCTFQPAFHWFHLLRLTAACLCTARGIVLFG